MHSFTFAGKTGIMETQQVIDFERIAKAITYITQNFKSQPSLDEVAESVNLSPFHFQKLFTEWAGVSPKKFLQYISIEHAKNVLLQNNTSLFDASQETGLSGTGRLHDLFINIEGMTPGEYKNGGADLNIYYECYNTRFGKVLIANTNKGICHISFIEDAVVSINALKVKFPKAVYYQQPTHLQKQALNFFNTNSTKDNITLHIKGTPFQLKVWEALLHLPSGSLSSYNSIACAVENPKAVRAVGSAIGSNPIAYLIPCHRVIHSTGVLGNYHWGSARKAAIIGWEALK